MKILQTKFSGETGWETLRNDDISPAFCNLVIIFGSKAILSDPSIYNIIRNTYANADILINSTAGEIIDTQVNDNTISLTAIQFGKTKIKTAVAQIEIIKDSFEAGKFLAQQFDPVDLINVLVISDGQKVNASDLVMGLQKYLPQKAIITGGLAGDGSKFQATLVGLNELPKEGESQ